MLCNEILMACKGGKNEELCEANEAKLGLCYGEGQRSARTHDTVCIVPCQFHQKRLIKVVLTIKLLKVIHMHIRNFNICPYAKKRRIL